MSETSKIDERFNLVSEDLRSILKELLQFNPQKRITAPDCIANKFFDPIRDLNIE